MQGDSRVSAIPLVVNFLKGSSAKKAPFFGSGLPVDVKMKQVDSGAIDGNSRSVITREASVDGTAGPTK